MTLLADLYTFFREHQYCGDLDAAVEDRPRLDDLYVRREDRARRGP